MSVIATWADAIHAVLTLAVGLLATALFVRFRSRFPITRGRTAFIWACGAGLSVIDAVDPDPIAIVLELLFLVVVGLAAGADSVSALILRRDGESERRSGMP